MYVKFFIYFISVVLKGIRSYQDVYCAIKVLKLLLFNNNFNTKKATLSFFEI